MILSTIIICYHYLRGDNLSQTLRFFIKRNTELSKNSQLILVSLNKQYLLNPNILSSFQSVKHINLNFKYYHKTKASNIAVRLTDSKILILLDSDRVLPENYFSDLVQTIKPNEVITTVNLFGLIKDYTDQEIESNDFVSYPDFRSTEVAVHKKNLFSGNTVMFTDDYWRCGGMDEEFIGYGFADNDMTQRAIHNRLLPVYLTHKELHLYHPREIQWNNASIDGSLVFQVITLINCVRYLKKWTLPVPQFIKDQISSVDKSHLPSDVAAMYEQVVENKYFMV